MSALLAQIFHKTLQYIPLISIWAAFMTWAELRKKDS